MNRVLKIIQDNRGRKALAQVLPIFTGKSPLSCPLDAPETCSFCGNSIRNALFRAWSQPKSGRQLAVICPRCIEANAVFVRFTKSYEIRFRPIPEYGSLRRNLLKRLACEDGTAKLKEVIVDLGIRLLQRSSAILAGCLFEKCDRTGVNLALPRIAIITEELNPCADLLRIVCGEIGIPFRRATMRLLSSGFAYRELVQEQCCGMESWAEHAVIFCSGYALPNANSVIVYAAQTRAEIPDDVEKIVPGEG